MGMSELKDGSQESGVRSQNKHTAGPWFAYDTTVCTIKPEKIPNGWRWKKGERPKTICNTAEYDINEKQKKANAKLIAAAPEMLEALNKTVSALRTCMCGYRMEINKIPNQDIEKSALFQGFNEIIELAESVVKKAGGK